MIQIFHGLFAWFLWESFGTILRSSELEDDKKVLHGKITHEQRAYLEFSLDSHIFWFDRVNYQIEVELNESRKEVGGEIFSQDWINNGRCSQDRSLNEVRVERIDIERV